MIFRSAHPGLSIPVTPYPDYILETADEHPEKAAVIDGVSGRSISYGELKRAVDGVAAGLARRGLVKGDVVAIDSPNVPEYVVAFLAIAKAGGVVTTISPLFTSNELGKQLSHSRARFLVTVPGLIEKAKEAAALSAIEEIYTFGEAAGATPFETLMIDAPPPEVAIDAREDLIVMPYSSGTTGLPKGVMLTHHNLVANIEQILAVEPAMATDVVPAILPFFHIYGMVVVMGLNLRVGATLVTQPRFELESFLAMLQKYGVTRINLVPPIILALARHPSVDKYDLDRLRHIMSGAAPLGPDVQEACARRIGCLVRQGYGLTETSPVTHCTPVPPAPQKPGSVGPVVPETEMVIADLETGEPLGIGEEGEVRVRGPQVMKGYFNNEEATAAMITPEGWLRTGDVGRADVDGYLYIVDRAKELIKYKGYQVPPAELEAVLLGHPAIADAAVIGVEDEEAGEVPMAFVVRAADVSAEEILHYVAENVAPYKRIRYVEFRDSIPKSPSGKILRRLLKAELRGRLVI